MKINMGQEIAAAIRDLIQEEFSERTTWGVTLGSPADAAQDKLERAINFVLDASIAGIVPYVVLQIDDEHAPEMLVIDSPNAMECALLRMHEIKCRSARVFLGNPATHIHSFETRQWIQSW